MKIWFEDEKRYRNVDAANEFKFWGVGKEVVEMLTKEELEKVWAFLENKFIAGVTSSEVNDFFYFDTEILSSIVNVPFAEIESRKQES